MFDIPYDIDILEQVFRVKTGKDSKEELEKRPLYNQKNEFFHAKTLADVIAGIKNPREEEKLEEEMQRAKELYNGLSKTY